MSIRKVIPILIFFAGAVLGKPLALSTIGLFAKAYLYFENGWHFSFGDIDWHEGKLIFSEVNLEDPAGSLQAKSVSLFWSEHHLEIEQPEIEIKGIPSLGHGRSDWTVEAKNGVLVGEQFGRLSFSFEKTWRHHLGRVVFEWGASQLAVEGIQEEDEIWIDADLSHFDTQALNHWTNFKGILDGRVHLVFQDGDWKRGAAHLRFQEGGFGTIITRATGAFDWEGDLGKDLFEKSLQSARIRLNLSHADIIAAKGGIEEIRGNFSLTAGVGAKWEFEGIGLSKDNHFPIEWTGKAFLHGSRPRWIESTARSSDCRIAIQGSEESGDFHWQGEGKGIDTVSMTLIQSIFSFVDNRFEDVEFDRGKIDIKGDAFRNEWNILITGEDLLYRHIASLFECGHGRLQLNSHKEGAFELSGARAKVMFSNGKSIEGREWFGSGEIIQGALAGGLFQGTVEENSVSIEASGTLDDFQLKAMGKEEKVILRGSFEEALYCNIQEGNFKGLEFEGTGRFALDGTFSVHLNRFSGSLLPLLPVLGVDEKWKGNIESVGIGFQAEGNFVSYNWFLQTKGHLADGIDFYCPLIEKREEAIFFDFRVETPTWDFARLYGKAEDGICIFDPQRTHFLGSPLQIDDCRYDLGGLVSTHLSTTIDWKSLSRIVPLWIQHAKKWEDLPLDGHAIVRFSYAREGGSSISIHETELTWQGEPLSFNLVAEEENRKWRIRECQIDQFLLSAQVQKEETALRFEEGKASWEQGLFADFSGELDSSFQFEFHFPYLRLDLNRVSTFAASLFPVEKIEGILEGKGVVSKKAFLEADFDFVPFTVKTMGLDWQNKEPIHLRYASDSGILCSGLDGCEPKSLFSCKIGLLQQETIRSRWILNHCQFHLTPEFLKLFPKRSEFLPFFDIEQEIDFFADLECPTDFSSLSCHIKQASPFFDGVKRNLQDISFSIQDRQASAHFFLDHQGYPVKVFAQINLEDKLSGRFIFEDGNPILDADDRPLCIDWSHSIESGLLIHEIGGSFGGVDASFHALDSGTTLIGSARINFDRLSKIIPDRVAQVFTDLKIGDGYELKGKLSIAKGVSFRGIFSGKQIDLFGYQLRTLLSQFELDPGQVRLYDLKISDSAGMLKIDELLVSAVENAPWTISIPHLTILELRPSLLQRKGKSIEPAGPLVVRELKIDDFKGNLEDSKTYSAKGELSFINSYRREHTVFDIPSDLLGRIVGLDLELLIPACGILEYELKNGFFYLTGLSHSFSEAQRSEFFLVSDPLPTMDLDGNLHIVVSMKQFVLFKLTESFQILVDGKLDNPQFHLQKKRRFLGL